MREGVRVNKVLETSTPSTDTKSCTLPMRGADGVSDVNCLVSICTSSDSTSGNDSNSSNNSPNRDHQLPENYTYKTAQAAPPFGLCLCGIGYD